MQSQQAVRLNNTLYKTDGTLTIPGVFASFRDFLNLVVNLMMVRLHSDRRQNHGPRLKEYIGQLNTLSNFLDNIRFRGGVDFE